MRDGVYGGRMGIWGAFPVGVVTGVVGIGGESMPLRRGKSERVIGENIGELMRAGYPREQAVAIAYDKAREGPAEVVRGERSRREERGGRIGGEVRFGGCYRRCGAGQGD